MNYFKFLYDVFVWITQNYSKMPAEFQEQFPESTCVDSRLYLSSIVQSDSDLNNDFKNYE